MILECTGRNWTGLAEGQSNGRGYREVKPELPASVPPVAKSRRWRYAGSERKLKQQIGLPPLQAVADEYATLLRAGGGILEPKFGS